MRNKLADLADHLFAAMARLHEAAAARAKDIGLDPKARRKLIKIPRNPYRRRARQETTA